MKSVFVGIDPGGIRGAYTLAALDNQLELIELAVSPLEGVLDWIGEQQQALVAVNSPRRPNKGLMDLDDVRAQLNPPPKPGTWTDCRVIEYELWQRGLRLPKTPADPLAGPAWRQRGYALYAALLEHGFGTFHRGADGSEAQRGLMEVSSLVSYSQLLGRMPFSAASLEGRIQRQLVLYARRVAVADPLRLFEEITRYRLLQGVLPLDDLHSPSELKALVAALTAQITAENPAEVLYLGHPEEGQVVVPGPGLKTRFS